MAEALIFDFDGLIVDSEGPDFLSWQEVWRDHGLELGIDEWAVCIGSSGVFDEYSELEKALGRVVDREIIRAKRRPRFRELLLAETIRPGVLAYLEEAEALGLRLAIASSASRGYLDEHLIRLGLAGRFDVVVGREDAGVPKPDPAVYRVAIDELGVSASSAIAFEDSPNGIAAAKSAGLACVAVPCSLTAGLDLSRADLVLASLDAMSLKELLGRVAGFGGDRSD